MPLFYIFSERQLSVLNRFMITDQFNKNVRKSLKSLDFGTVYGKLSQLNNVKSHL